MPAKVLCPKCRAEIGDPANLKRVTCPSCSHTFDAQPPPARPNRVIRVFATILVLCTLVALWVTAARVKALKLAARRGEVIEPVGGTIAETAPSRHVLRSNDRVRVGHFSLHLNKAGNVAVLDATGRPLVEFLRLKKGDLRRWQELQLTFAEVSRDEVKADVEFKPGAPCFGGGQYRALRAGLQIEFPGGQSATILAWDAQAPEIALKFQSPQGTLERKAGLGGEGRAYGLHYRLQRDPDGEFQLTLDDLD